MKATTVVWLAARNVGDANDSIAVFHGSFTEVVMLLAEWLGPRSMAKRFDLCLGRSEEETRAALRLRKDSVTHVVPDDKTQSLMDSISAMMQSADTGEASDET